MKTRSILRSATVTPAINKIPNGMKGGTVLSIVILLLAGVLTGCATGFKSFLEAQPVSAPVVKQRPVTIEVLGWEDHRTRVCKQGSGIAAILLPLWPYGVGRYQDGPKPVNPGAYDVDLEVAPGSYEIPALLARYLSESRLGHRVFIEGEPFSVQNKLKGLASRSNPGSDLTIRGSIDKYMREDVMTVYGLTVFGSLATGFALSGDLVNIGYDFSFSATDEQTGQIVLQRRYSGKGTTGFYPLGGVWLAGRITPYDAISSNVHQACKNFVAELDKVLPPPEDEKHWAEVAQAREIRVAKASGTFPGSVELAAAAHAPKPTIPKPGQTIPKPEISEPSPPVSPTRPSPASSPAAAWILSRRQIALIIGIDEYQHYPALRNAVADARAVGDSLGALYGFEVRALYNEQATRDGIISAVRDTVAAMAEGDDLLIYYAGHGWEDNILQEGYWVPVDATKQSDYVSNAELHKFIRAMEKAQHVFLVADSCFSGEFLTRATEDRAIGVRPSGAGSGGGAQSEFFRKMDNRKARQVLTSGASEPVPDGGREGHSVFGYYFLRALNAPDDSVFTAAELVNRVSKAVGDNSSQTPLTGTLKASGHEEGQMVFQKKN